VIGNMPTYEYLCKTCGHRFETWQKMTDDPLTTCPDCGAAIRRVLFPAGVVFKGSGFYKTDHRDSASIESSAKDEPKPASDGTKTETTQTASDGKESKKTASDGNGSKESKKTTESASSTTSTPSSESKPATTTSAA